MLFSCGVTNVTSFAFPLLAATVETSDLEGGFEGPASRAGCSGVSLPGVICDEALARPAIGAMFVTLLLFDALSEPLPSREK